MANKKVEYKRLIATTIQQKYPYFLVGISILIVLYLIFTGFLSKNKLFQIKKTTVAPTETKKEVPVVGKKYLVQLGDHLWRIAEQTYGSGYNAYDIAIANKIADPSNINPGQELVLPQVSPKPATRGEIIAAAITGKITITGNKYTVVAGDYLWKIALKAYGDGYAWVKIASANQLANPDFIHAGNVLIIPR